MASPSTSLCLDPLCITYRKRYPSRLEVGELSQKFPTELKHHIALVEPLAVAWHAVNISPLKKGDSVLILGGGPIGLAVVQALKAKGADRIIVSEMAPRRKEFAKHFGADYVLDPTKDDIIARVREICDGKGANLAFDAAGVQPGLDQAVLAVRARGTLVNIAVWAKPATIVPNHFTFRERHYMGITTYVKGDFQEVIDAIASGQYILHPGGSCLTFFRETETGIDDH